MSGGKVCRCDEARKPIDARQWVVRQRNCNHSAFNGGHYTWSEWSAVICLACHACWRTTAVYVRQLRDHPKVIR